MSFWDTYLDIYMFYNMPWIFKKSSIDGKIPRIKFYGVQLGSMLIWRRVNLIEITYLNKIMKRREKGTFKTPYWVPNIPFLKQML